MLCFVQGFRYMGADAKRRVLVVDDSTLASRQLEAAVNSCEGFEVVGRASNGAEALSMLERVHPDIVCLDIVMPVMNGLQALRSIQAVRPNVKVIMVSSLAGVAEDVREAMRLGASDVIVKPFDRDTVEAALKAL